MGTQTVSTVQNLGTRPVVQTRPVESEAAALHRLAAQAKARGVKIIHNIVTNHHWATSASQPGKLHAVTLYSCDCAGFLRHARCMHFTAILEMYHSLPPIEPDPDGTGAALPVPTATVDDDVVLSIVPSCPPVDQANRTACAAYLDSDCDRAARWELTSALMGEDYFTAGGLTDRALDCWARTRLGLPTLEIVCTSALCGGRGSFSQHPTDGVDRCAVCRGAGVIPGHSVNVAVFAERAVKQAA